MILVIDDCPRRRETFRKALGENIRTASSLLEAAAALTLWNNGDYSTIYLDHDGVDGEQIALRLADMKLHTDAKIVIHSSNYIGATKMRDILKGTHDVEIKSFDEIVGDPQKGGE